MGMRGLSAALMAIALLAGCKKKPPALQLVQGVFTSKHVGMTLTFPASSVWLHGDQDSTTENSRKTAFSLGTDLLLVLARMTPPPGGPGSSDFAAQTDAAWIARAKIGAEITAREHAGSMIEGCEVTRLGGRRFARCTIHVTSEPSAETHYLIGYIWVASRNDMGAALVSSRRDAEEAYLEVEPLLATLRD